MRLTDWARRYNIPRMAIVELLAMLGMDPQDTPRNGSTVLRTETDVQNAVRLEASRSGGVLWRNNVGAVELPAGGMIRYGLANDSAAMNKRVKSSDLIGIRPRVVLPENVGETWGIFTAREVKRPDWVYTGTKREVAQRRFIEIVTSMGGDARFTRDIGTL